MEKLNIKKLFRNIWKNRRISHQISYKYNDFVLHGIAGLLNYDLSELNLVHDKFKFDFSYPTKNEIREYVFGISMNPLMSINITRYINNLSTISMLALDSKISQQTLEDIAEEIKFVKKALPTRVKAHFEEEFMTQLPMYQINEKLSKEMKVPVKNLVARDLYAYYLNFYRFYPVEESLAIANIMNDITLEDKVFILKEN